MAYEKEKDVIRETARVAGYLCLKIRNDMLGTPEAIEKAGKEPVTIADFSLQAIVHSYLLANFPDDGAISEEKSDDFTQLAEAEQQAAVLKYVGKALDRALRLNQISMFLDYGEGSTSNRVWTVDPIDGTKGFIRGDQFAVAIALLVNGIPTVAALCCPALPYNPGEETPRGAISIAVRGEGATIEPMDGSDIRPLKVSDAINPAIMRTLESVEAAHTDHDFNHQVLGAVGIAGDPVRIDSQAKYLVVADGRAEIYIRTVKKAGYNERIWDHAAGALIVVEAGGTVTDLDGKPLDFTLGDKLYQNSGILATNGPAHDALVAALAEAGGNR